MAGDGVELTDAIYCQQQRTRAACEDCAHDAAEAANRAAVGVEEPKGRRPSS